jgi:hypothetical protein
MRKRVALASLAWTTCLVFLTGCGDQQKQSRGRVRVAAPLTLDVEAILAAAQGIALDSLCVACRTILVDSTAQRFPATKTQSRVSHETIAVPWNRLREALRSSRRLMPAPYNSRQVSGDSAAMYFYLARDSTRTEARHVGVVIDAPSMAGWVVDIDLERRNEMWHTTRVRYRQP